MRLKEGWAGFGVEAVGWVVEAVIFAKRLRLGRVRRRDENVIQEGAGEAQPINRNSLIVTL